MQKLRPPPSLDPRCIDHRLPVDPRTGERAKDSTIAGVRSAFSSAYTAMENLIGLRDAVAADTTMTAGARELKIRNAALAAGERSAKLLDSAREKATAELARVQAESLPPPPRDPAVAAEIRSALRGMDDKTRARVLNEAVEAGDAATVGAVLSGPKFLSGTSDSQAHMAAFGWRGRFHAEELARIKRLEDTLQAVEIGAGALLGFVRETASSPIAAEAERAQARTAEAQAALRDNPAAQPAPAE